jgi:hypothetical protein
MASIYDWSTTAASNSSADGGINWAEGQDPGTVNDSARQMMGRLAEILGDIGGALSAGGTANGLTVTANSAFTTYANGRMVAFKATADNSAAATLSVNGIGAKAIRKMDSTGDVALAAGEIKNTGIFVVRYSTALNGGAGAWLLINPTVSPVSGPTSATDNAVVRFDGTTGKLVQNSSMIIDDVGGATITGALNVGGGTTFQNTALYNDGTVNYRVALVSALQVYRGTFSNHVVNEQVNNTVVGTWTTSGLNAVNIGATTPGTGNFTALTANSAVSLSPANQNVVLSPTGTGVVTISPATVGTIDKMNIGGVTAGTGAFTTVTGTTISATTRFAAANGSAAAPSHGFTNDADTGLFVDIPNALGIAAGGSEIARFNTTGLHFQTTDYSITDASVGFSLYGGGDPVVNLGRLSGAALQVKRRSTDGRAINMFKNELNVGGATVSAAGTSWDTSSDARKKRDFRPFDSGALLDQIDFGQFEWIETGGTDYGVLAQAVQPVYPLAIHEHDGWLFADYAKFIPLIGAEVKALRKRVAELTR